MKLLLQSGYPFPYPANLSSEKQNDLSETAGGNSLELSGVVAFEWKFTVTVQFENRDAYSAAIAATGWKPWNDSEYVLEAQTSVPDGYEHAAVIANGMAWCGFIVSPD